MKNPHAVKLGRAGGLKGGPARAKKLTKQERSDIAKIAAKTRWEMKKSMRWKTRETQKEFSDIATKYCDFYGVSIKDLRYKLKGATEYRSKVRSFVVHDLLKNYSKAEVAKIMEISYANVVDAQERFNTREDYQEEYKTIS